MTYPSGLPPYAIAPAVANASAGLLMDGLTLSVIVSVYTSPNVSVTSNVTVFVLSFVIGANEL